MGSGGSNGYFRIYALQMAQEGLEDWKGKQLERLNSAIKKVRSGKEETHREEER